MKLLQEIGLLFRNTLLVTVAVILGFVIGSALGVPVWLQGFCLLPAALLFHRLSSDAPFAWGPVLGFVVILSGITFIFSVAFPHVPQGFRSLAFFGVVALVPVSRVTRWLERLSGKAPPADAESTTPKPSR